MKISKLILEDFKAVAETMVFDTNKPVVCLVGENNTGKTTVFKAIDFLRSGVSKDKTIDDYKKGSGVQRAFALAVMKVYADFLIKHPSNSDLKKPLFFFIDEPEISLHPRAQKTLIESIITISRHQQVFITTHSPFLLKHFASDDICTYMTKKVNQSAHAIAVETMRTFSFSPTLAEINYFTYEICSTDFHNELYGYISSITNKNNSKKLDSWLHEEHSVEKSKSWIRDNGNGNTSTNLLTLMSYIRHSIHHPENTYNQPYTEEEIHESTKKMIDIIKSDKFEVFLTN